MSDAISEDDPGLFGWVPAPARGQGRPAFLWTREKSNRVMVLFASGYKQKQIAPVIGCDVKTLRKVFPLECRAAANAALVLRSGMMVQLAALAEGGNVGALKQLDKMIAAEQVRAIGEQVRARAGDKAVPAPKLGKKEQAKADAAGLSGRFGTRQAPPALLN